MPAPQTYVIAVVTAPGEIRYGQSEPVVVSDEEVTGVELRVRRGALIRGRVVRRGADDPKAAAKVDVLMLMATQPGRDRPHTASSSRYAKVAPGGSVEFAGLEPGTYVLAIPFFFSREGFEVVSVERDSGPIDSTLTLWPGEMVDGLVITVASGAGAIRGRVIAKGLSPAGLSVVLRKRGADYFFKWTDVDARGAFAFGNLLTGTYEATVQLPNGRPIEWPGVEASKLVVEVPVIDGQTAEAILKVVRNEASETK